jgi:hypothetical protein
MVPFLAIAFAVAACETLSGSPSAGIREPGCRDRFASCAPPVHYDETTDARSLELRRQVEASLRLDLPERVSRDSAKLVLKYAQTADVPALLQLAATHENEWAALGKCQCPGVSNEWDNQKIGAVLERRLPSAELRTPKHWEDRMVARFATMRDLQRKMALRGVAGEATDDLEAERRKADLELCEAVHGARASLLPNAYADMVEAVRRRRDVDAGPSAAELAQKTIRGFEKTTACSPVAPAAAPPAPSRSPAAKADDDDDER